MLQYEGDFVNGIIEGRGKMIWGNGNYYIGEFKGGCKHGKGTKYNSDGSIRYEGDYANDFPDGNGKCYFDNGDYYIGEFKLNLRHGKGTLFDKDGNIKFDGTYYQDSPVLTEDVLVNYLFRGKYEDYLFPKKK